MDETIVFGASGKTRAGHEAQLGGAASKAVMRHLTHQGGAGTRRGGPEHRGPSDKECVHGPRPDARMHGGQQSGAAPWGL